MRRNTTCPICGYPIKRVGAVQRYTNYKGKTTCTSCVEGVLRNEQRFKEMKSMKQLPDGYRELKESDSIDALHAAGKLVDMCVCGHSRPKHTGLANHGPCEIQGCFCDRFTWSRWIVKEYVV